MACRSTRHDPAEALLRAWSASARMNVFLIERLLSRRPTAAQAKKALAAKRRVVLEVVGDALHQGRRIVGFPHDAASYLIYYIAHDSHHRGQVALQARLLGYPLDPDTMSGLWQWTKRAAE